MLKIENIPPVLTGTSVRLEPLGLKHVNALAAAARGNEELFKWTFVPQGITAATAYVQKVIQGAQDGTMYAFAIIDVQSGRVLGSTRFWNLQIWDWPQGHDRYARTSPDVCEIGYTWLTAGATRTRINTEAKLLLLAYAFETWRTLRVCFQTDLRNARSRAAIERIGGKFEGIIRADRLAADDTVRDTARFSIVASEWESVKKQLSKRLI